MRFQVYLMSIATACICPGTIMYNVSLYPVWHLRFLHGLHSISFVLRMRLSLKRYRNGTKYSCRVPSYISVPKYSCRVQFHVPRCDIFLGILHDMKLNIASRNVGFLDRVITNGSCETKEKDNWSISY